MVLFQFISKLWEAYTASNFHSPWLLFGSILLYVLLFLIPLTGFVVFIYWLLSLPMRRREKTRLFLKLLESGLAKGQSAETAVTHLARIQDQTLGLGFHFVAAHVENGLRLGAALQKVPSFLPSRVAAMLAVGERLGDPRRVLPACRRILGDTTSRMVSATNLLVLAVFLINPLAALVWPFLVVAIIPKLQAISSDETMRDIPGLLTTLYEHRSLVLSLQFGLMAAVFPAALLYSAGPWLPRPIRSLADAFNDRLPWRRKRLQRDFSGLLALLLDAGVPEQQAVTLAAQGTANRVFIRRGDQVVERLRAGVPLVQALRLIDDTGEFQWRLSNAAHGHGGFLAALTGWHDSLDAKAFQLEQTASQMITSALVVLNGCIVGLIAVGIFQVLTSTTLDLSLW